MLKTKKKEHDQAHIFQDTFFESSQMQLPTIISRFEHKNHDSLMNFLF